MKKPRGPGNGANTDPKIRLMRTALTQANYGHRAPKGRGQRKQPPITLVKTPWDDKPEGKRE